MEDKDFPSQEEEQEPQDEDEVYSELKTQLFFFKVYKALPIILMVLSFVTFFIVGIVDSLNLHILGFETNFVVWLVWTLIGVGVAIVSYFFSKVIFSQKILQIYYLQKIAGEKERILEDDEQ